MGGRKTSNRKRTLTNSNTFSWSNENRLNLSLRNPFYYLINISHCPNFFLKCGRSFDPRFLFTWPTARVAMDTVDDMVSMCCAEVSDT